MAKNNNTLVFNGLMQGMSWDLIKEAKDEIKRYLGEKPPTRKDILTDWIIGKDYMLQLLGNSFYTGGFTDADLREAQHHTTENTNWLGVASSALLLAGDTFSGYNDIKNKEDEFDIQLNQFQNQGFNIGDNAFLASEWDNRMLLDAPTKEQFGYIKPWKAGLGALPKGFITAGITNNVQFGEAMAVADFAKSLWLNSKAKEALEEALRKYNIAQGQLSQLYSYSVDLSQLLNAFNQLQHMTKEGGKLKKSHKFAEGGLLNTYDYGLEEVNAGGSHEENPNEGVVVSYAPDGLPNKVEEGETIHNDYVYSKRLEANEKVLKNNLLDEKYEGKSFADISKKLTEDRKQRPNDPISVRTNEENLDRLQDALEELKLDNKTKEVKRFLGSLNNDLLNALQLEMIDEYKAYAELLAQQLEQEDLAYQEELAALEGIFGKGGHLKQSTYGSSYLEREPWYTEPTIVSTWSNPLNVENKIFELSNPINLEPYGIYERNTEGEIKKSKDGKPIIKDEYKKPEDEKSYFSLSPLRLAEVFGSAGLYLSDSLGLTNQPDYSNARMYQRAIDNIGGVNFTPIGNYLTYNPIDTEYLANQQMATAAARRNYGNVAGNYTLGLLNDYNTLNQIGATAIAAKQQDLEQRHKYAEFNRATNDRNSAMSLDAQKQNAALRALRALGYRYLADMMTKERDVNEAARAANYLNFISNLAAIGRESYAYDQIRKMAEKGVFPVGAEYLMAFI